MLLRILAVVHFSAVAFGSNTAGNTRPADGSTVTSYLATFEGIPAGSLPLLSTVAPPRTYEGLNYDGAVVIHNAAPGQYVTDRQTDQGTQYIAVNTLSTIVFSTPDAAQTFNLKSAYIGIGLSADNSVVTPALDGVLAFTGTKPDGSKVVETAAYRASGPGIVKVSGVVLEGKALLQKTTFNNLNGVTAVEVTVQSAAATGPVTSALALLGLDVSAAVNVVGLDSLEYDVITS